MDKEARERALLPAFKVGYLLNKYSNIDDNSIILYKNLTKTLKLELYVSFDDHDNITYNNVAYIRSDLTIDNPLDINADDRAKELLFAEQYAIIHSLEQIILKSLKKGK